jgi:hypothetical protein
MSKVAVVLAWALSGAGMGALAEAVQVGCTRFDRDLWLRICQVAVLFKVCLILIACLNAALMEKNWTSGEPGWVQWFWMRYANFRQNMLQRVGLLSGVSQKCLIAHCEGWVY